MDPFSMVVAIVLIVAISRVLRSRYKAQAGFIEDENGKTMRLQNPDAERLREEMKSLKERVAVLERIATDTPNRLESEIEALRDER